MGRYCNHKVLLNCCNFLFLVCGTLLIISGFYLFTDPQRILLSRLLAATSDQLNNLPQPLFYYISIGLAVAGLIAVLAAIVGFWATCLNTYCFLSFYFLTVVILLLAESVACLAITLWPHCLGINLDETKMVKALQGNYGVPGKEQFTIAMDLAQARFGCCGMNSDINYDTSMWKLQGYGQHDWTVPLTCCLLQNFNDKLSHLDPKPTNETLCESVQKDEYIQHRYTESCLTYLDTWYRQHYVIFLIASLIIAIVEFAVLLTIILNCTRIATRSGKMDGLLELRTHAKSRQMLVENIYEPEMEANQHNSNHTILTTTRRQQQHQQQQMQHQHNNMCTLPRNDSIEDFKELYVQPRDLYKHRHNTTFKPICSDYQRPNCSYLV